MATCYQYCCDVCGKKRSKYYPNNRRYTFKVRDVKVTVSVNTTNYDELCNECFDALVKEIGVSDNFKEGRLKR